MSFSRPLAATTPGPQLFALSAGTAADAAARLEPLLAVVAAAPADAPLLVVVRALAADDDQLAALLRRCRASLPGRALGVRLDGGVDLGRVGRLVAAADGPLWLHLAERAALLGGEASWRTREGLLLGCSRAAHDAAGHARNRALGLDTVLAPIGRPATKPDAQPLGLAGLRAIAAAGPVIALGGLTPADVDATLAAGAWAVATQSGLTQATLGAWLAALSAARRRWRAADGGSAGAAVDPS